ncbi:MAG: DUF262 domain-containing protein [Flavobacteriaceae bacterium]|nr:DUF262 domain-containing protein [Flavobacteriaceae bacterium]
MEMQKYNLQQPQIGTLLAWIDSGEIAIPEIQRPFVWDSTKVRNLLDSIYKGFPIGYIITWRNPKVRLKDGTTSEGKKVLIDGQQRITALTAALKGQEVVTKEFKKVRIKIAFNPLEERFEVLTPVIDKEPTWISDISTLFSSSVNQYVFINDYIQNNNITEPDKVAANIGKLASLVSMTIGMIDLAPDLDIETVTEIFIRINSAGVELSQADFVMSKIAASEEYGGQLLRKAIDYFSHLAVAPEFYPFIKENDKEFVGTDFFKHMEWLRTENEDLYDPTYTDVLRVAFTKEFQRGKLADLVALLSGRNFETRKFEAQIAETSFAKLRKGVVDFINETSFKRFLMSIRSAGFITASMIRSQNAINFAYIVYLTLKEQGEKPEKIEHLVRRWYVMSVLTGRYSGSPESRFDLDIRRIGETSVEQRLLDIESGELSDAFWDASLIQSMNTSVASSPIFKVYLAAQVKFGDKGFLSRDITVQDLLMFRGDVHHVFPKNYMKKQGLNRSKYNQIANYVYMQQDINIQVSNRPPAIYFNEVKQQCVDGETKYGGITSESELRENLERNCIPDMTFDMDAVNYQEFLEQRRRLMAKKIKNYYEAL